MNKPIIYEKQPITRVLTYLTKKHYGRKLLSTKGDSLNRPEAFLQQDYGLDMDCAITSMATILYHKLDKKKDFQEVYNIVEQTGMSCGYTTTGTSPFAMGTILTRSAKALGINAKANTKYGKGVMWSMKTIIDLINKNKMAMLSFKNDGRNYYGSHSVTVIGYAIYEIELSDGSKKTENFIKVYDNWTKEPRWIDYEMLNCISSVHSI